MRITCSWVRTVFSLMIRIRGPISKREAPSFSKHGCKRMQQSAANATILCGMTIGQYAFIGAGAVVTRHVRDFALIVGNPGRQLGWMCICAQRLELSTSAQPGSTCVCRSCQRTFDRTSSGLIWRMGNGNNLSSALASTGESNNCE